MMVFSNLFIVLNILLYIWFCNKIFMYNEYVYIMNMYVLWVCMNYEYDKVLKVRLIL